MGHWGGETLSVVFVCAHVYVHARTHHMVCRVCEVTGKCFLYVPSHAHMSIPSVSAVICAGTNAAHKKQTSSSQS